MPIGFSDDRTSWPYAETAAACSPLQARLQLWALTPRSQAAHDHGCRVDAEARGDLVVAGVDVIEVGGVVEVAGEVFEIGPRAADLVGP